MLRAVLDANIYVNAAVRGDGTPGQIIERFLRDSLARLLTELIPSVARCARVHSAAPGGAQSHPYGIAITSDGEVWYSESGVKPNTLVRFDPKSESFSTEEIPSGGGVVRHMVATPDGRLYLACSGVNKVAVADSAR